MPGDTIAECLFSKTQVVRQLKEGLTDFQGSLTVEAVNGLLSHASSNATINALIFVAFIFQEVFKQVQHFGHLG